MAYVSAASNPFLAECWYLDQIFHGNANRIWNSGNGPGYTGAGIRVGVFDDGLQKIHADLDANIDTSLEFSYAGVTYDPAKSAATHGTAVAGIIAAEANNNYATVGIAYDCKVTGVPVLGSMTNAAFMAALSHMAAFDVVNNSWGFTDTFVQIAGFDAAIVNAAATGRHGLGTIIVNASGNDWAHQYNANAESFSALRQTISVSGVGQDGDVTVYATRGASVLVSGPTGSGVGKDYIVTLDANGGSGYNSFEDIANDFSGTSAAAPVVSGVATLMLDANAGLGWRDVQSIMAITADHTTPAALDGTISGRMAYGWQINGADTVDGGGMHYSNDVGYGRIDAFEAVRFAEAWLHFAPAQTSANEIASVASYGADAPFGGLFTLPGDPAFDGRFSLDLTQDVLIESVALTMTITVPNLDATTIVLISPEGTRSTLLSPGSYTHPAIDFTWTFTTEALRGENAAGTWQVEVNGGLDSMGLFDVRLQAFGTAATSDDVYHFTNEFAKMAALDATRAIVQDVDGGIDWINVAASEQDLVLDLNAGATSRQGGAQYFSIAADTTIENALAGDGRDTLIGNDGDNHLVGMRGDDRLLGNAGADWLTGGLGNDVLIGDGAVLSTSSAAAVRRLYLATLAREPDAAGQAGWTSQLDAGKALAEIAKGFTGSAEFSARYGALDNTAFVTLLYSNVLHRTPDAGGLASWANALTGGASRESVVTGFSESAEFQAATDVGVAYGRTYRLYQATLGREPDAGGWDNWAATLASGVSVQVAAQGFVGSAEFQATYGALDSQSFVALLYANVLGRAGEWTEITHWSDQIDNGTTSRAEVVAGFSESAEFIAGTQGVLNDFLRQGALGNDVLDGGAGADTMSGGSGADIFRFNAGEGGTDRIYGYEAWDQVQFVGFGYASEAEAASHLTQQGNNAIFSHLGETIIFINTKVADIDILV